MSQNTIINTKKQLAIALSKLEQIKGIDLDLEQYQTDSELGAEILWKAHMQGDIENSLILDLGCGNGIFGIGSLLLGAKSTVFVDKSPKAISALNTNVRDSDWDYEIIDKDIEESDLRKIVGSKNKGYDKIVTLMNPPFGTKQKHIDRVFLKHAFLVSDIIYSIHKSQTLRFLESFSKDNEFGIEHYPAKFCIKKSHIMHKKKVFVVDVLVCRFCKL